MYQKKIDGIRDRFQRDLVFRDSQLKIGWNEEKCIAMDKLAQEDHSNCTSPEEYETSRKNWYISWNKSGRTAPMKLRSDFRTAVTTTSRLHRESGEERPEPIFFINTKGAIRFFFQYLMVAVECKLVELFLLKRICFSKIVYS